MGYEQSYVSALELGLKGPPAQDFAERLAGVLRLSPAEAKELAVAIEASQRKFPIDPSLPEDVHWFLSDLRAKLPELNSIQVRLMKDILRLSAPEPVGEQWRASGRVRRRNKLEAQM